MAMCEKFMTFHAYFCLKYKEKVMNRSD